MSEILTTEEAKEKYIKNLFIPKVKLNYTFKVQMSKLFILNVYDCRSNKPVKNAKVKKLTISLLDTPGSVSAKKLFEYKLNANNNKVLKHDLKENKELGIHPNCYDGIETKRIYTDNKGQLKIIISSSIKSFTKIEVQIGFIDFPVNATKEIETSDTVSNIIWKGPQTPGCDNDFGWRYAGTSDYFSTEISLKNIDVIDLFTESPPQFDLTALQWCQPCWYEKSDDLKYWIEGDCDSTNKTKMVPADLPSILAIGTRYDAGGSSHNDYTLANMYKGKGRDYGTVINSSAISGPRGGNQHAGIDYAAIEGDTPVFAAHGGKVDINYTSSGGYGHSVVLKIRNSYYLRYAHLFKMSSIKEGNHIMTGKQIGKAGRTYKAIKYKDGPTHLHFEVTGYTPTSSTNIYSPPYSNPKSIIPADDEHTSANIHLFLNNTSYRLFPCDCDQGKGPASSCAIRGGNNGLFPGYPESISFPSDFTESYFISSYCWASWNLYCPYMKDKEKFRVRAQLTYLAMKYPTSYKHTSDDLAKRINGGEWNDGDKKAIRKFREKHATQIYIPASTIADLTDSDWENFPEKESPTRNRLNIEAPLKYDF